MQVIAKCLSEEETAGLKEMFKTIDSGQITYEELKAGLKRVGANLKESEILVTSRKPVQRTGTYLFIID